MNNTKKNILIILASLVFAVSPAASSCVLAESADNASSTIISNPESDSALIKRQAIASALDLSVKQITDLKTKLNSLKFTKKSKEIEARKSIISSLDESAGYYSEAKKQLAGKKTADDLRELAKSLRDYREKSYLPVSDKASGFLLVFQTSKLVDTVNSRYSKVDSDLNDLENAGIIEQDQFAEEMTSTKKHIDDALGFLEKAKKHCSNRRPTLPMRTRKIARSSRRLIIPSPMARIFPSPPLPAKWPKRQSPTSNILTTL